MSFDSLTLLARPIHASLVHFQRTDLLISIFQVPELVWYFSYHISLISVISASRHSKKYCT